MPLEVIGTRHRLPTWASGAYVSDLAWRVFLVAYGNPPHKPRGNRAIALASPLLSVRRVVDYLTDRLDTDEGDVLRALAELERVGLIVKPKGDQ